MSQFNKRSTASEVCHAFPDSIRGKTILVTGVSPGSIGEQLVIAIGKEGPANLILAGRNKSKLEKVSAKIKGPKSTSILVIDLDSKRSITEAAASLSITHLDVFINCAAVFALSNFELWENTVERQLGVNHCAPFLLVSALAPLLAKSIKPRIVSVSSMAHLATDMHYDDPSFGNGSTYDRFMAYSQSKTAVTLFAKGLQKHSNIPNLTSVVAHPGLIHSNIFEGLSKQDFIDTGMYNADGEPEDTEYITWKTPEEGAASLAFAAFDPSITDSHFIVDSAIADDKLAPYINEANADRCWNFTERLLGQRFGSSR